MTTRRQFLKSLGTLGAVRALSALPVLAHGAARAASAGPDYRALVCVFLYGGNDGHNTLVPMDATGYAAYRAARPSLALGLDQLVPLLPPGGGAASFGLHPDLAPLRDLWEQGTLATLYNVGPLAQPVTRAEYLKGAAVPENLFSHDHQQNLWQAGGTNPIARHGWGGRVADLTLTAGAQLPPLISLSGAPLFTLGEQSRALVLPPGGQLSLDGFKPSSASQARRAALERLFAASMDNALARHTAEALSGAVSASRLFSSEGEDSLLPDLFAGQGNPLAKQLFQVARLIGMRDQVQARRQVFFVSLGGFDTHAGQVPDQSGLFRQLAPALKSFHDAMRVLGVGGQVTSFTLSEFGRTLKVASSGTDHGWGSHHFILGGAVQGRKGYGVFPTLAPGGPDDAGEDGRFIPTMSVEQYAATLCRWFGVGEGDLVSMFPGLARFSAADVGFMV